MAQQGKILVFIDLPEGVLDETGRGLLSYAARLSRTAGLPWEAVVPAEPDAAARGDFARYGTPAVTVLDQGDGLIDTPARLAFALASLVQAQEGGILLLPHNDLGGTLAPVAAARLGAALMTETVSVKQVEGGLELYRQILGARLSEARSWQGETALVLSVPTRKLSQVLLPTVQELTPAYAAFLPARQEGAAARVTGRIPPDPQTVDLSEAEVIFSAGKGCDQETFSQMQELCRLLNVSCGVTRPVYDLGWTGFERMVGQTGRTVTPRLYLALGISGSMHHLGGIKDSRLIVSVNSDPKAPIFPNSDAGYVADLKEILPRLVDRARSALGGAR